MTDRACDAAVWPRERLGEALTALARYVDPARRPAVLPNPPAEPDGHAPAADLGRWIVAGARFLGVDADAIDVRAASLSELLVGGAPAMVGLPVPTPAQSSQGRRPAAGYMVLLSQDQAGAAVSVLARDGLPVTLPYGIVESRLFGKRTDSTSCDDESRMALVEAVGVRAEARWRAATRLGRSARDCVRPCDAWSFHKGHPHFWARVRAAGGGALAGKLALGLAAQLALVMASWWLVGRGALDGRLEVGWLWAWGLVLATIVIVQAAAAWALGRLAVQVGGLAKERLLEGILALQPEAIRSRGVGQLLGAVLEAEALESLARAGGPLAALGMLQLVAAAVVLSLGQAPALELAVLLLWLGVIVAFVIRYHRKLVDWADARLQLTDELVESMVGHRTLVVQQPRERRLVDETRALTAYERRGEVLDAQAARLVTLAPRGYLILAILGLAPAFAAGQTSSERMAVTLGGIFLAYWALRRGAEAVPGLAAAALAWQRTRPFFQAATEAADSPSPAPLLPMALDEERAGQRGLVVARDVTFRYASRAEAVLRGCTFEFRRGDRVLVEGASGSGKSTLGSLLGGLRAPSSGVLLLGGFDHHSLGLERWRQRSGSVPQFHENHVLSAPMVFNLLMGRRWPPQAEDWPAAQEVCRELGLGELLERMPGGLQQMVGDAGWQLSHGERSRLFIARSLLAPLSVRVLDESFAALDPETFERVLDSVLRRTETLVVVTHT